MTFITTDDLAPFADISPERAAALIEDAEAKAALAAPCLVDDEIELTDHQRAAVKAILRGAILRWHEAGSGAMQQETLGAASFTYDTRQQRRALFWPSEIEDLQRVCNSASGRSTGAFSLDTTGGTCVTHADVCSINLGATYCSCGASLAGYPLWETL